MEQAKIASFIRGLKHRSSKDGVEWIRVSDETYGVHVKDVLVTLEQRESVRDFSELDMVISFRDSFTNDLITEFSDVDLREDLDNSYRVLLSLYEDAMMSVTGYKKKLNSALDVFIKDDPEGDIPF